MARIKIGDIVEIKTINGKYYAQYTHKHPMYGALLRVFKGIHINRPNEFNDVLKNTIQFSFFFPLKVAINQGIFEIVANCSIDDSLKKFPLFRAGVVDPSLGKVKVWWLWDGQSEKKIGALTDEQKKMPIRGVWNDTLLIERLNTGWTPESDSAT